MADVARDGKAHIASLRDGRAVYLNGEAIRDVTTHPAFRNAIRSSADLYDLQADPQHIEALTFESPKTGKRISRAWQIPTSYDEMVVRRQAMERLAETHGGFMGRSPDHLASAFIGQYIGLDCFKRHGERYAKNVADYYEFARDNDIFLTYVIINPQGDRTKGGGDQSGEDLVMRVVDEDSHGLTVRGAKMLGTSSIMANEVFVAHLQPLRPGEEKLAVSFAIPMNTKGLKVLSRKSFEESATSQFDNPLSYRFDENDALIYFDDVKVPWERVFVNQDVDMCRAQFHDTPGHIYQNYQAQIRYAVKLKFLLGIAHKITECIGTHKIPPVQAVLGKLASEAATIQGMVYAMERQGSFYGDYFVPNRHLLYATQVYAQELYPGFVNAIKELAGGSLIMMPSSVADFDNPEMRSVIEKTQVSNDFSAQERVKVLKMAWDALGSEFAGRHTHYEMFYCGAQFVTRGHSYRNYDWAEAKGMVDALLNKYSIEGSQGDAKGRVAS